MGRIINYKLYKVDLVEERTKKRFSQFVLFTIIDVCCNSERAVLNRKPAPHQHPRSGWNGISFFLSRTHIGAGFFCMKILT